MKNQGFVSNLKLFHFVLGDMSVRFEFVENITVDSMKIADVLDNIEHQLELIEAHHIQRNADSISFKNSFLERGYGSCRTGYETVE
ncbi:hypothetical protein [Parabacteroides sp. FAFU027]|uniref:hypothetical protein n=1 Tax=Parabacteroides sp. FAFU027 TaxID=2922715 RepID=UPI001FAF4BFF|nr:hypothetical protein [Parabacteroides sp. FAFU027]